MQTNFGLVQLRNPSPPRCKDLTPAEFALAFSLYRDVICLVYPTRRTELDEYLLIELDMALRFGGSGFYTYHVHFASQAAGRIKQFNQGTYWGALDSELYWRIFAARASLSCQLCGAPSHPASACSVSAPPPQTPHSLSSPSRNASDFNHSDVTSIDLFEPIKKQPFIRKCYFVTSEEEEDEEEEDTCILPQKEPACQQQPQKEPACQQQPQKEPACQQQPQKVWVELDQETLEALKEMPRLVATMKTALDNISGSSSSGSCSSSGHGDSQQTGRNTGSNDLMFLGNSSVQVSTRLFHRLGNRRMSLFAQELATLIFGKETLAKSTLTGKGKTAETLDPEKVNAIIDTVREKIPGTEVSAIRALLRRKCNNERYTSNVTPH
ncbi:hypothetical protein JOQ06_000832 [Pogonophryne albipinna]|uniref:BEN domain-containing protein n=1 Tax=Pogonophryne albipinna TaxID=1090488 RepID=A0AAD6B4V4_9TELE|nr:hypothetical protein JOQ06_000832 [Pogonophryne albipinna]